MLEVKNINVYYGNIHALKDVSFNVNDGEIVALIGANGAGKSTTLKTVSGLLRSRTGDIIFNGKSIAHTEPYRLVSEGLAHVPEGRRIFLQMTVTENLEMGAYTRRDGTKEDIADVFRRFPRLKHRKNQIAGTLSGGEQQMLAVGRALMSRPRLIMMDEPSLGLAPLVVRDIFEIIKTINSHGITVLLIEQNANMALRTAHLGYVIETGHITMSGTGAELLADPRIKEAYLGKSF